MAMDYQSIISANNARIAELKKELAAIEGGDDPMDSLDLELAANRARAYDMNGATTALSRLESRASNRAREAENRANKKYIDDLAQAQKRDTAEQRLKQLLVDRAKETNPYAMQVLDSQIELARKDLDRVGGNSKDFAFQFQGMDKSSWVKEFEDDTYIGADGNRHWNSDVSDDRKKYHQQMAQYHGDQDLYKQSSTMQTTAERKAAGKKAEDLANEAAELVAKYDKQLKGATLEETKTLRKKYQSIWNLGTNLEVKKMKKQGWKFSAEKGFYK